MEEPLDIDWSLQRWFMSLTPVERIKVIQAQANLIFAVRGDKVFEDKRRDDRLPRDFSCFPLMEAALRAKEAEYLDELIIVYVPRQEDGVLRPVESTVVGDQLARLGPAVDPTERWQFSSGTIVGFETRVIDGQSVYVATVQG